MKLKKDSTVKKTTPQNDKNTQARDFYSTK